MKLTAHTQRQTAQNASLDPYTRDQLIALPASQRGLIVCDVDEVILHFVRPLEAHFQRQGFCFKEKIFKLTGNVKHMDSGADAPDATVFAMIHSYFEADAHQQDVVSGAVDALHALAEQGDILFLTNMPHIYREQRIACLADHGLEFPLVTNTGPKGPALSLIAERQGKESGPLGGAVWFVDDSPQNLFSVADHAPHIDLVHFVADPEFLELATHVPQAGLRTNCWTEARTHILDGLKQAAA